MKIKNFRELKVWLLGKELSLEIYKLTRCFPHHEMYGLTSQMRRCVVSIPSNIAEGFNRYHNREYRQFLYFSLGSCAELETQLEIAKDLCYVSQEEASKILEKIDYESKMLRNLIKKLMQKQDTLHE